LQSAESRCHAWAVGFDLDEEMTTWFAIVPVTLARSARLRSRRPATGFFCPGNTLHCPWSPMPRLSMPTGAAPRLFALTIVRALLPDDTLRRTYLRNRWHGK
jgi:hypothetical protein